MSGAFEIKIVGVVGCGVMGAGIAQLCAQKDYQVIVSEKNNKLLKKGIKTIENALSKLVHNKKISANTKKNVLSRIKATNDMNDFKNCDIIIEAVPENLKIKQMVFSALENICSDSAILATNTSVLKIMNLAKVTSRPQNIVGIHFLTPAPVIKFLEIIKTSSTSDETLEKVKAFGHSLEKEIVVVDDSPGFIVNRLQTPLFLNAIRMLDEGIATKEDIDKAVKLGLKYPMGPFELLDLIGIDTVLKGAEALYNELKDEQYAPPRLMKQMVENGHYGRKTGKGFYEYTSNV